LSNGCVLRRDTTDVDSRTSTRFLGLPDRGWAVFHNDREYQLHGHPGGRFWWSSGLCRFEAGELDHLDEMPQTAMPDSPRQSASSST
jgi:hypothetical protein